MSQLLQSWGDTCTTSCLSSPNSVQQTRSNNLIAGNSTHSSRFNLDQELQKQSKKIKCPNFSWSNNWSRNKKSELIDVIFPQETNRPFCVLVSGSPCWGPFYQSAYIITHHTKLGLKPLKSLSSRPESWGQILPIRIAHLWEIMPYMSLGGSLIPSWGISGCTSV